MLITIEIDVRAVPIGGWLQAASGSRLEFQGMLELISLLEMARREVAGREVVGAPPRAAGRR
jgi:hypothetical protein